MKRSYEEFAEDVELTDSPKMTEFTMDWPKPFITTDEDGKLSINQDVVKIIDCVEEPLVIVAVVGNYRTGKSYLLNRLMGKNDGFPLGSSVQSKTKGIWIWIGPHPTDPTKKLLLLDTEGLSDPQKANRTHDIWIFSLAILLSSTFVYNSIGTIDNNSINDLHMTAELTEHLKMKVEGDEEGTEFTRIFPMFIWAVRDFYLKPEIDGKMVSPDEYLEHCLSLKTSHKRENMIPNSIKQCIRDFFGDRHCCLFPSPANNKEKLQNLDKLEDADIEKDFLNVAEQFTDFVFKTSRVKQIEGNPVNGRMFANLSRIYLDAIREGKIPCIESAVKCISEIENTKARQGALDTYNNQMSALEFPVMLKELSDRHQSAQKRALKIFLEKSVFDKSQEHQGRLAKTLAERFSALITENEQSSSLKCKAILEDLRKGIEQQIKSGTFLKPGGYATYTNQMAKLERDFKARPKKGVKALTVFKEFMEQKDTERKQILNADKRLKENEKKIEEERMKVSQAEATRKAKEEELARTREQIQNMKTHYEEGMRQYKEDMERKTEQQIDMLTKTMNEQKMEHERLMKEGFKDEANLLKDQIQQLQNEMKDKKDQAAEANRNFQEQMMEEFKTMNDNHAQHISALTDKISSMRGAGEPHMVPMPVCSLM